MTLETPHAAAARQPKCLKHERHVPIPFARHHQHRRRGEMRQRAADGYVDKQQPQRGVGQLAADAPVEIPALEHERQQRHRRRFGDERTQQRPKEQRRDVKRHAFARRNQPRRQRDKPFRQLDHRARGGDHHDDENKLRFGEVEALDVVHRVVERPLDRRDARGTASPPTARTQLRFPPGSAAGSRAPTPAGTGAPSAQIASRRTCAARPVRTAPWPAVQWGSDSYASHPRRSVPDSNTRTECAGSRNLTPPLEHTSSGTSPPGPPHLALAESNRLRQRPTARATSTSAILPE